MSAIFGGSKSKQQSQQSAQSTQQSENKSWNDAYGGLVGQMNPVIDNGVGGNDFLAQLLGLKGMGAAQQGFDQYKESAGYKNILEGGNDAINANAAAKGMLNSGATLKAVNQHGQDTMGRFYNSYLDRLLGLGGQGIQAGSLLGQTGQKSTGFSLGQSTSSGTSSGSSSSKPGIAPMIGSIASAVAASERRLKEDIVRIGRLESGIPIYRFRYIGNAKPMIGVMVEDVETVEPQSLGPVIDGNRTVDYDNLEGWRELL